MKPIVTNTLAISLIALSLSFTQLAYAGLDEGLAAYNKADFKTALKEWKPLAEQGDADAQNNLGVMYANGQGVAQDDKQAVSWYRKAAEQGDAKAQYNLGNMYDQGRGVAQDDKQAASWYRKAAEQGHAQAQNNLGVMYDMVEVSHRMINKPLAGIEKPLIKGMQMLSTI